MWSSNSKLSERTFLGSLAFHPPSCMAVPPRRYLVYLVTLVLFIYVVSLSSKPRHNVHPATTFASEATLSATATTNANISTNATFSDFPSRANATFVALCRNSDLKGMTQSVMNVEWRFNSRYHYPWVFLNEEPFTEEFKEKMKSLIGSEVYFGVIPHEHWYQPDWINETLATEGRNRLVEQKIIYGDSVPYRNMCRFNSGYFYRHELLLPYRYYWRVEPDVEYFCHIDYDPFLFMEENDKIYGFTISLKEWEPTIPTLWDAVKEFIQEHPEYVSLSNSMSFLSDDDGESYNLCHFWSNFEIADLDFWRGEAYSDFFDFLERKGGFYYERWGDAPVHSIAAALFARKNQLHFFRDIGYHHPPFQHCPPGASNSAGKCWCHPIKSIDYRPQSCIKKYETMFI